jgi:hypothetical protein
LDPFGMLRIPKLRKQQVEKYYEKKENDSLKLCLCYLYFVVKNAILTPVS